MKTTTKYHPFQGPILENRQWPSRKLTQPPQWCSVDLRDGNQALATPMSIDQKMEMFGVLVQCGFKEIEVGFPSASDTDFGFIRKLIEGNHIPSDVTIQVLVPAREELIDWTVDSLVGAQKVIIHLYNSTSPSQRRIVFGKEKPEIVKIAVDGATWVKKHAERLAGTDVTFQYSPESFSATEMEFALEVCEAVINVWQPTPERKVIINLPDTVEVAMANIYADQIEWICQHISRRDSVIVSVHTHNDRGTSVAATELGLLAGAERVEGTLFGNGERTGNLDIITVALNLYTQGIDPCLDFSNLGSICEVYERCTGMVVPPRQPYSGDLVFTAFSGSHQDAIRKGLRAWNDARVRGKECPVWEVPYLTLDPEDLGRTYTKTIRVNGQSGKGGMAFLLEKEGIFLPKEMQADFGAIAKKAIDSLGREVDSVELKRIFWSEYVRSKSPYELQTFSSQSVGDIVHILASVVMNGDRVELIGKGNGPIAAFIDALKHIGKAGIEVSNYAEHTLGKSSRASAIAYICIQFSDGKKRWGVGVNKNMELASIKAIVSALNRE
jgi:2-isopropylmalate synthase